MDAFRLNGRTAVVTSAARGTPQDIAWAVLYLAADASRFVTGQLLRANGGVYLG